jgi:triphosphatase
MAEFMEKIVDVAREREYLRKLVDDNVVSEQALQQAMDDNQLQLNKVVGRFKEVLASPRYNLIMLGISEWLFFKQWRAFLSESEQARLEQPIIDYALAQLEHMLRDLKREIGPKINLDEEGYLAQVPRLRRALDVGLFFGGLFDSKQRQKYRQPWLDLLAGTREILFNRFAEKCFRQYQLKTEDEIQHWMQKRSEAVLEAMEQTRKAMFKARPYWLK